MAFGATGVVDLSISQAHLRSLSVDIWALHPALILETRVARHRFPILSRGRKRARAWNFLCVGAIGVAHGANCHSALRPLNWQPAAVVL